MALWTEPVAQLGASKSGRRVSRGPEVTTTTDDDEMRLSSVVKPNSSLPALSLNHEQHHPTQLSTLDSPTTTNHHASSRVSPTPRRRLRLRLPLDPR